MAMPSAIASAPRVSIDFQRFDQEFSKDKKVKAGIDGAVFSTPLLSGRRG